MALHPRDGSMLIEEISLFTTEEHFTLDEYD